MNKFSRFIPIILASGVISFVLTPLVRRLADRLGFVDKPSARKVHLSPIPMLGGVAIYMGLATAVALSGTSTIKELAGVLGGATVMVVVGLWDDRFDLRPMIKLVGQAVAAGLLALAGIKVSLFSSDVINILITIFWVLGITNAINFLDNMDGLAAGLTSVSSAFFLILALEQGLGLVASLAAATLGASVAFLYYNFNPASLFMGDAGSMLLGFVLAVLGIKLEFRNIPLAVTWSIPIIILGVPIFDTTLIVISRIRRGRPFYRGGKDHTSHRLVGNFGMSSARAVMTLYLASAALGLIGLMMPDASILQAQIGMGILGVIFIAGLIWLEWRFAAAPQTATSADSVPPT